MISCEPRHIPGRRDLTSKVDFASQTLNLLFTSHSLVPVIPGHRSPAFIMGHNRTERQSLGSTLQSCWVRLSQHRVDPACAMSRRLGYIATIELFTPAHELVITTHITLT